MIDILNFYPTGDPPMFGTDSIDKIKSMSAESKIALIKESLYSSEHMLKILVKVMLVADPEAAEEIIAWFSSRVN